MTERIAIHPVTPQPRLLERAAQRLADGALLLIPTDADYCFAWSMHARDAQERVVRLRALDTRHPFTLLCARLSEIGSLAKLDDRAFRLVKSLIPGPYTFVLPASGELPRRLKQARRRDVGCRVPDHPVAQALLATHGEPLVASSAVLPGADDADATPERHEADAVADRLLRHVDLMLDAGDCPAGPTSVIDLEGGTPRLVREGRVVPEFD